MKAYEDKSEKKPDEKAEGDNQINSASNQG